MIQARRTGVRRPGWQAGVVLVSAAALAPCLTVPALADVRLGVTLWFLLICPGLAWTPLLGIGDALTELAMGAALSMALGTIASVVLLSAGWWYPGAALTALATAALAGVGAQAASARRGVAGR